MAGTIGELLLLTAVVCAALAGFAYFRAAQYRHDPVDFMKLGHVLWGTMTGALVAAWEPADCADCHAPVPVQLCVLAFLAGPTISFLVFGQLGRPGGIIPVVDHHELPDGPCAHQVGSAGIHGSGNGRGSAVSGIPAHDDCRTQVRSAGGGRQSVRDACGRKPGRACFSEQPRLRACGWNRSQ